MAVMLSAPSPSVACKLAGQLTSIIISTHVASPVNLLLFIAFSNFISSLFLVPFLGGDLPALFFEEVLVGLRYGVYVLCFSLAVPTKSTACCEVMQSQMPSQAVIMNSSWGLIS